MSARALPPTPRGRARREKILDEAARIVASRGYHSASVKEIGAAAGVSGAALYRHFDAKNDLLVALFDRAIDRLLMGARAAVDTVGAPLDVLCTLVKAHVGFALRERSVLAVYGQELHNLPDGDRRRLRRKQRDYVEIWRVVLLRCCGGLSDHEALARVEAVFGLMNSVPNLSSSLDDVGLADQLNVLAVAALTAGHPGRVLASVSAARADLP
jgi:AcrR family transcriptional regulator